MVFETFSYLTGLNGVAGPTGEDSRPIMTTVRDTADGTYNGETPIGAYITLGTEPDYTLRGVTKYGVVLEDSAGRFTLHSSVAYTNGNNLIDLNTSAPYTYCFLDGTMIATPSGEVPVEYLRIGHLVLTEDGRHVPVKWLGEQRVKTSMFTPSSLMPVCIAKGALGGGLPHTDLLVSADHGLVLDGHIVNASALVNGSTIRFVPMAEMPPEFTYFHIETEAHDAVLANGAAAETFIDPAGRKGFDNYAEYLDLYGADALIPAMDRPRISSARMLPENIKARLAPATDWDATIDDPAMTVSLTCGAA
ncbi:MAG: Hint domain-containing protein [Pseudomonadota bacterium]